MPNGSALYDGIEYRIVGFKKLRELLQPEHKYFEGDYAWVKDYSFYQLNKDTTLCYPRIQTRTRNNPYRKTQLRSKHTATTIKKLWALRESAKLEDFKVAVIVPTFPKEVSEWLSEQKGGVQMCWRLFHRFWTEDFSMLDKQSSGQAAYVNLHTWKTEKPTEPHYHFHCIVPNYRLIENGLYQGEGGDNAFEFKLKKWYKQPFTDKALEKLKRCWHKRVCAFAYRHKIRGAWTEDYTKIDLFVEWVAWSSDKGRAKLMNKLNYQSRHWLEDYAKYSNEHLDCPCPPKWLEGYNNNTRVFGWWKHLKSLTAGVDMEDKEKLSPFEGEPMEYKGTISIEGLLYHSDGKLGSLEFYKGQPLFDNLSSEDIEWLRSVEYKPP